MILLSDNEIMIKSGRAYRVERWGESGVCFEERAYPVPEKKADIIRRYYDAAGNELPDQRETVNTATGETTLTE